MASPELQSKVNQLTATIEGDLTKMVDEIERFQLRPLGRKMHACIISCYDKAGKNGRKEQIEQCSQQCQIPNQKAAAATQQEIANFQNRLNRAMMQCNDEAQGMITPDMQHDSRKMKKVEGSLLNCIQGAVNKSTAGLKPMKQRIESQMS
mmetsp:Transcript_15826/g.34257  ORF Transcript_15826/g.34257 Transcript_15826/m.34257 type:complete len:150 (-) Transcript_15826:599-1048(-)|eukprot:CAMPEP_0172307608 /NCGR_PEP_ID=MMETSP1058-20130122/8433_1 /TAXON_ID=83371 /ORGANISM="Detonula confervacea, Strain CCMP 353" /LENGTH=149 /DNA_ID=CAMNT_0013019821 /DNA_START=129 /DNA_END=578 /DNA_ORIENTATION=+